MSNLGVNYESAIISEEGYAYKLKVCADSTIITCINNINATKENQDVEIIVIPEGDDEIVAKEILRLRELKKKFGV